MSTIYHDILKTVTAGNAAQIEAARRELEIRAAPLRGGETEGTVPVSTSENTATRSAIAAFFDKSIEVDGLIDTCVEARRAITQLIESVKGVA